MKLEIKNLHARIESLKKKNINLEFKAKVTKLPESTKTKSNIEKLNESKHSR